MSLPWWPSYIHCCPEGSEFHQMVPASAVDEICCHMHGSSVLRLFCTKGLCPLCLQIHTRYLSPSEFLQQAGMGSGQDWRSSLLVEVMHLHALAVAGCAECSLLHLDTSARMLVAELQQLPPPLVCSIVKTLVKDSCQRLAGLPDDVRPQEPSTLTACCPLTADLSAVIGGQL